MNSRRGVASALAITALVFSACSTGGGSATPAAPTPAGPTAAAPSATAAAAAVEIDWYHIQNNDPGKALWQTLADEYVAAHPNVKVNLNVNENEAFKTKLSTLVQANTPPDLFQSWGGGGLREQAEAGLVQDITSAVASWTDTVNPGALGMYQVDGKQYGIPFDLGMVGFWYNTDQFEQAGITEPPATWDDFLADVQTLKDEGLTPIALAGQDTWTGAFYWAYLAIRECGKEGMDNAVTTGDWSDPCFVKAGEDFMQLIDLEPFQEGFLGAKWDGAGSGAASMATENGAIQLMGQWLPGTVAANSDTPDTPARVAGLVPVPRSGRWRRRSQRRPWRRQRFCSRPRRAARDARLPALPCQRGRGQPLGRTQ